MSLSSEIVWAELPGAHKSLRSWRNVTALASNTDLSFSIIRECPFVSGFFSQSQHLVKCWGWQSEFSPSQRLLSLPSGNSPPSDDQWNHLASQFTEPFPIQFFICVSPVRSVFLLTSLFRRGCWSSEKWNDLSKAAQQVKDGMRTRAQSFHSPCALLQGKSRPGAPLTPCLTCCCLWEI